MINLDDKEAIVKIQGGGAVLESVDNFPRQIQQAWEESQRIQFPDEYRNVHAVVVSGMGGSRFPAFIVKELFKEEIAIPYFINDDYRLPGFINEHTLVILSSYSGTTEETLANGKHALEKKAKITGITEGGELALFLEDIQAPSYIFHPAFNPSRQPRIGFGYAVGAHLGFLYTLGFLRVKNHSIDTALEKLPSLIQPFAIDVASHDNPAKRLAASLYEKYPYYIVSEFLTGIGNAIANQTNETAKSISSFRILPELNHHLLEGLKFPQSFHGMGIFVFFYSSLYSPQIQKRFHITRDIVEQNGIQTLWYELKGETKEEQAFELMALGSYITMYLAALYEQDPSAIPYVDYLKKKLSE